MEMLGALIVWVVCGIAGAMIAAQKGRSVEGWAILCFLLGPLGVILALVASRDETGLEAQALERGSSRKCPPDASPQTTGRRSLFPVWFYHTGP